MNSTDMTAELSTAQLKALELFCDEGEPYSDAESLEITINFHPDRLGSDGQIVLSAIASDGFLRSQFETGTSNGGLSAFAGGDRWNWESAAFHALYDTAAASDRPKYGALNHRRHGSGGSPRFGSCYFVLKNHILDRTTFCFPESWLGPKEFGHAFRVAHLIRLAESDDLDTLDNYIEAHVHGNIKIKSDVEKLVLDPCFRDTEVERAAERLGCNIEWHNGFTLQVARLNEHLNYRGAQYVALAHDVADQGIITPNIIGHAVNNKIHTAQDLKKVWHYLAKFGDLNTPGYPAPCDSK